MLWGICPSNMPRTLRWSLVHEMVNLRHSKQYAPKDSCGQVLVNGGF